jgi:hypothetical protein
LRRHARIAALAIAAGALLALPAEAKNGVRAILDDPVNVDAKPGSPVRVAWHLADEEGHPFGASGIYLRVSRCGRPPLRVPARERAGGYFVRFKVPNGGIRKLMVGLKGSMIVGERKTRRDAVFNFVPAIGRRC